jgi:hypothetical protein
MEPGSRGLISVCGWILALAVLGAAQGPLAGFDPLVEHSEAVRAERAQQLLDAWKDAGDAQRDEVRELLKQMRRSNAPAAAPPTLLAIHAAWSALREPPKDPSLTEDPGLVELAASLDLRAVPGFFSAREEGEGDLVTVRVARLWPAKVESTVQVNLRWMNLSDSRSESEGDGIARSEPATPGAFEGAGFDLFVRAPPSPAGTQWMLAVELVRGEAQAWSRGVIVQCVNDASAALEIARDALEQPGPNRALAQALLAAGLAGARVPVGLLPSDVVDLLRSPPPTRPGASPRPLDLAFREASGRERWIWVWMPVEPVERALVLLAPQGEPPEAVFAGARGQRWREAAQSLSALLISTSVPRLGSEGDGAAEVLARVQTLVQSIAPDLPIAIVARGDALDSLHPALAAGERPCSALIAATPREGAPRLDYGELKTLILAPGGPETIETLHGAVSWVHGERLLWLDELRLPELAASWFASALPAAPRAQGKQGER